MGREPPVAGWQLGADGNWYPPSSPDFTPAPDRLTEASSSTPRPTAPPASHPAPPRGPTATFGVINPRERGGGAPAASARGPVVVPPAEAARPPEPAPEVTGFRSDFDDPAPTAVMWAADSLPPHVEGADAKDVRPPPPTDVAEREVTRRPPPPVAATSAAGSTKSPSAGDVAGTIFGFVKFVAFVVVVGVVALFGYSYYTTQTKPTTKSEVCAGLEELRSQTYQGNGYFGNPVFRDAKDLGSKASRYPGDASVQANGSALTEIGESNSTTIGELSAASRSIAKMCGRPPILF